MTVTELAKAAIVTAFTAIALTVYSGVAAAEAPAPTTSDAQVTATNPWE